MLRKEVFINMSFYRKIKMHEEESAPFYHKQVKVCNSKHSKMFWGMCGSAKVLRIRELNQRSYFKFMINIAWFLLSMFFFVFILTALFMKRFMINLHIVAKSLKVLIPLYFSWVAVMLNGKANFLGSSRGIPPVTPTRGNPAFLLEVRSLFRYRSYRWNYIQRFSIYD